MATAWAFLVALLFAVTPGVAHAFSAPQAFFESASAGGGDGRWFTGSPADGYGCSTCHTPASPRRFPLYISGLPGRYSPGLQSDVLLSWPEFAQRWTEVRGTPGVAPVPGAPFPSIGLVAELVAQSGEGSGTIEIDVDTATVDEQCESVNPAIRPRLGVQLYQVRAGIATEPNASTTRIRADEDGILRCESRLLAQRCIIALTPCGAKQVRFRWTAPPQSEGTVWFAAGFVASENISNSAAGDSVFETVIPIVEADSPSGFYEETLETAACHIAGAGRRLQGGPAAIGLMLAFVLGTCLRRRRS